MSSEPAISVEGLGKCYQIYATPRDRLLQMITRRWKRLYAEFWALREVSFDVGRGETVGIIGRNGAGKSTLLQLICGTLTPTCGSMRVRGRVAALLELGAGFNPEFTGRENVFMNAALLGLTRRQIEERFERISAFADIGAFIEQPVKTYSSGMTVRLSFAVIAHVDADILIIDEALAVGDAFFTQKCMRFLRDFMQAGTVLFVSHDTATVKALCDRVAWIDHGRLMRYGPARETCDAYLEAFYEEQQGRSTAGAPPPPDAAPPPRGDMRLPFLNASNLRNDLAIAPFEPAAAAFGTRGAAIVDVHFADSDGRALAWVVGGEAVTLTITARIDIPVASPIIGFFIKDRRGQYLFGDNTWLSHLDAPVAATTGDRLQASFSFDMPRLPAGDYSIAVGVASGSQESHRLEAWLHDALLFRSESSSVASGLIGIPMARIELDLQR
jgi:lipopolysaccharide transport system ATP-binding protein